jgi:adenine-specific DNA-methyltransferase
VHGDAAVVVDAVSPVDLAYVDPPYNQHRYFTNYHIWETLIRWDAPEHYGVACKRVDSRDDGTRSVFNSRRTMPSALADLVRRVRAEVVVVSYNDESWISADELTAMLLAAGHEAVRLLAFDRKRYVGALIGIHNPAGQRVGEVGRRRNLEYVFVAGPRERVDAAAAAAAAREPLAAP